MLKLIGVQHRSRSLVCKMNGTGSGAGPYVVLKSGRVKLQRGAKRGKLTKLTTEPISILKMNKVKPMGPTLEQELNMKNEWIWLWSLTLVLKLHEGKLQNTYSEK